MATANFTAQMACLDLLRFIGVTGFTAVANDQSLNQPGLDADDTRKAIAAVNSALQTIQKHGPQSLKFGLRSASYVAPGTLSLTISGATPKIATPLAAPPSWMLGCSVMIDGDADLNRIMAIAPATPFAITFLRGYLGTAGAGIVGTVYSDCASLDADVQAVLEPVSGTNKVRLYPAPDIESFERLRNLYWGYGWGGRYGWFGGSYATYDTITTQVGRPAMYYVERQRDGTPALRVSPMPPTPFNVTFQAKLRAERITTAVLDLTGASDPGYFFLSLADDEVESVMLPIARWRFVTGHPSVKNAETRAALKLEYDEVYRTLQNGQTFAPSVSRQRARYT